MSAPQWRDRAAAIFAVILIISFSLSPWLLSEVDYSLDRELPLPSDFTDHIPNRCEVISLYIGYPGCFTECPAALGRLARSMTVMPQDQSHRSCFVFMSLFPDQQEATAHYAHRFHPEMLGISLNQTATSKILTSISLRQQLSATGAHRDWLYTLNRESDKWILSAVDRNHQEEN